MTSEYIRETVLQIYIYRNVYKDIREMGGISRQSETSLIPISY